MANRRSYGVAVLVVLLEVTMMESAMVLPRPPSSPNHIRHDNDYGERTVYKGKAITGGLMQSTNVERPDTEDYRLLEIELQGADDMDAANLQQLVHSMLKNQQQTDGTSESHPNPEVMPNSILGVRDIGLTPNFRLTTFEDDKRVLLSPPKLHELDEKLYYLKSGRPKVYVNVRGKSGAFRKDTVPRGSFNDEQVSYIRVTRPFVRQNESREWKPLPGSQYDKKLRPPKKYENQIRRVVEIDHSTARKYPTRNAEHSRMKGQAVAYGAEDLSTTENSMVTSSELPKQIPAPPSKVPTRLSMAQTTPVQRYALRRTDILPGYSFAEE